MISLTRAWPEPAAQRRLAAGLGIVLAVVLAWLLAKIFWMLVSPAGIETTSGYAPQAEAVSRPAERVELDRYHLFGEAAVDATVAAWHDAPETALNMELRGIVSSADPESGFAIIVARGRQSSYRVGQEVPGGAEVRGIYPDRVVLFHAGRYETLRLPVERLAGPGEASPAMAVDSGDKILPMAPNLAGWENKLSLNLNTAQYSLIPVRGGGYRLFLSRDAEQMVQLGLRNGDVVRSANGIPLDSQEAVEQVFEKVLSGESLTLLVLRDGAELSLTPDLEQFMSGVR